MSDTKLSSHSHTICPQELARKINLESVVDEFVKLYPNCGIMLS